jgi:thymidylate kinase
VVLVVDEVARSCLHTLGTIEAQEWIWHEQMAREKYAMAQDADVIICDRTVMDNLMYYHEVISAKNRGSPVRWYDLYSYSVDWMPTYTQVIRLPLNLEWLQADDPIRSKDVAYARRIDALFDRFVQPYVTPDNNLYKG